jgi:nitrate/nitrite-specific signal transduction histidine kinase
MNPHFLPLYRRRAFTAALVASPLLIGRSRALAQVGDINDAINKAGRQRMLSQRMAKAWLSIGLGIELPRAQRILNDSMALFDRQFVELKAYAPSKAIRDTYVALESVWGDYKTALVGQQPGKPAAANLVELDGRVLKLAHQGTVQFEQHSGRSLGRLVNIAGRERMLSQRMAKFYLVQAWRVTVPEAGKELEGARTEFVQALETLREAPEATSAIRQELELADQQWTFFDNALRRVADAAENPQRAVDVFISSENILQVMDRVTGLYARAGA